MLEPPEHVYDDVDAYEKWATQHDHLERERGFDLFTVYRIIVLALLTIFFLQLIF